MVRPNNIGDSEGCGFAKTPLAHAFVIPALVPASAPLGGLVHVETGHNNPAIKYKPLTISSLKVGLLSCQVTPAMAISFLNIFSSVLLVHVRIHVVQKEVSD